MSKCRYGQTMLNLINYANPVISIKICSVKKVYRFSILAGSIMMPLNKPKNPSTAMPKTLNGRVRIQKIGYNIKAKIANGQQNIKSMIHAINVNMV